MAGDVVAILVHFGDVETTARCLAALAAQGPELAVTVSNNGSREEAEALRERAAELWPSEQVYFLESSAPPPGEWSVAVIHNGGNRGFAAGCNAGIRAALARPGTGHIWLVNNDAAPEPGALDGLVRESIAYPRAILGATLLASENRLQLAGGAAYHPATTVTVPQHAGASPDAVPSLPEPRLDYVYGASLFAPASLFQEVGLLNETFFLFYEELDLCRRATAAGYALRWCRDCRVRHEVSASVGRPGQANAEQARLAAYHEARSTILFTRLHHPLLLPVAVLARTVGKAAVLLARGEARLVIPSLTGLVHGLTAKI